METETLGRVTVTAKVQNLGDLILVARGLLSADQVRSIEVNDALVDTGATILSMAKRMIQSLGLSLVRGRRAVTNAGTISINVFGTARLTIQGRECPTDVSELPDECQVQFGQIPLESLGFVVDMRGGASSATRHTAVSRSWSFTKAEVTTSAKAFLVRITILSGCRLRLFNRQFRPEYETPRTLS